MFLQEKWLSAQKMFKKMMMKKVMKKMKICYGNGKKVKICNYEKSLNIFDKKYGEKVSFVWKIFLKIYIYIKLFFEKEMSQKHIWSKDIMEKK